MIQKITVGIHLHRTYGVVIQKNTAGIHLHRTYGVIIQITVGIHILERTV